MGKTAFIFPGQGAQYVGMGHDFYDKMPVCRQVIDKASQVSGLDYRVYTDCHAECGSSHIKSNGAGRACT